ncbi:MAG: DUF4870 domain-containing protein [Anaerolineae bacterium]|jgi:hypothetical protein
MGDAGGEREKQDSTARKGVTSNAVDSADTVDRNSASVLTNKSSLTKQWTTAALVHASVLLTLVLASAGGVGALIGPAIPFVVYLSNRQRSRFIVVHALQSLAYQGAGVLAYVSLVAILAGVVATAWTISGVLSVVVIGFLLMPLALSITILMVILLLGAPLVWVGYGLYGAYRVYQGVDFRYWLLGEWVDREVTL